MGGDSTAHVFSGLASIKEYILVCYGVVVVGIFSLSANGFVTILTKNGLTVTKEMDWG